jgi:hypothetical protein
MNTRERIFPGRRWSAVVAKGVVDSGRERSCSGRLDPESRRPRRGARRMALLRANLGARETPILRPGGHLAAEPEVTVERSGRPPPLAGLRNVRFRPSQRFGVLPGLVRFCRQFRLRLCVPLPRSPLQSASSPTSTSSVYACVVPGLEWTHQALERDEVAAALAKEAIRVKSIRVPV